MLHKVNRIRRLIARMLGDPMFAGSLPKVVTRGHTGRSIAVDRDFYRAQELGERSTLRLQLSPWAWRVGHELRNAPLKPLSPLVLFRARPDDCSTHGWEEIGPPPIGLAPNGRYNRAGESVLYLSDSEEGVCL